MNRESTRATTAPEYTDRHGRLKDELRDLIEGMSVSIDVSTGDHDAGHRLFGVVNEVMDDDGDKCGVTLLVYEAKPNFEPDTSAKECGNCDGLGYRREANGEPIPCDLCDYRAGGEPATDSAGREVANIDELAFIQVRLNRIVQRTPPPKVTSSNPHQRRKYTLADATGDARECLLALQRILAAREPAPVACKWPTCQSEAYQDKLADEIYRQLYSGEPAPVARELDVEAEFAFLEFIRTEAPSDFDASIEDARFVWLAAWAARSAAQGSAPNNPRNQHGEEHARPDDQGAAQDERDDAGRIGGGGRAGADEHHEHREAEPADNGRSGGEDRGSAGVSNRGEVRAAVAQATAESAPASAAPDEAKKAPGAKESN